MFTLARRRRKLAALTLATLALAAAATACEGDDDTMSAEACDSYAELQASFFGDPAAMATAIEGFVAVAPEAIDSEADALAAAATSDDPAALESAEVTTALQVIGDQVYEDCKADTTLDVRGVDYAFSDLPDEVDAGRVAIRFTNESAGDEPHELVLATGTQGQTADELAGLPIEELFAQARPLAVAFTESPDQRATTLVDLEPGSYVVICTLPVGGFSEAQQGPPTDPHSAHGMVQTLTVV